jgi:predicted RNase H-like HicB family nuclease
MKAMARKISRTLSYSVFYEQVPEGGYVALVPMLPGCHTQGETLEETERNVAEAIELYLESLVAHGEPIPEEGRMRFGNISPRFSLRLAMVKSAKRKRVRPMTSAEW